MSTCAKHGSMFRASWIETQCFHRGHDLHVDSFQGCHHPPGPTNMSMFYCRPSFLAQLSPKKWYMCDSSAFFAEGRLEDSIKLLTGILGRFGRFGLKSRFCSFSSPQAGDQSENVSKKNRSNSINAMGSWESLLGH